eukprot:UN09447
MLVALTLFAIMVSMAFGARKVVVEVKNCTKSTDESQIQSLQVTPSSGIQIGQNFTISGDGIPVMTVNDGYFNATAKWEGVPIFHASGDACAPDTIKLPLDVGIIWYGGCSCPIYKGVDIPISVVAQVHPSAPDATVYVTMVVTDSATKNEVFCVDVSIDIGTI